MGDFDKLIWGFIFSVTGIAFGWTLNQFGQWFRGRQDDKKNLKLVLFNLFELYFLLHRSDLDKFISKIADKVLTKIPIEQQTEEARQYLRNIYLTIFNGTLLPDFQKDVQIAQESYNKAINNLASIDPLTAYYLSGKTTILEVSSVVEKLLETLKKRLPV